MKNVLRWIVIGAILAALVLGYYWYLSNLDHSNDNESSKETKVEEVDRILNKDLDAAYPETPRGVVKWYNRIITEYYAREHSDSEITGLANQTTNLNGLTSQKPLALIIGKPMTTKFASHTDLLAIPCTLELLLLREITHCTHLLM